MNRALKILAGAAVVAAAVAPQLAPSAAAAPVRMAWAGDSLTAGSTSWLNQWSDAGVVKAGGYAKSGYTTAQVLAAIQPQAADVLVIMLGTNDVRLGVPVSTVLSNLDKIVAKVGAANTVLVMTPPSDRTTPGASPNCPNRGCRTEQFVLNRSMTQHAAKRGWLAVDPWSNHRLMNQGWSPGADTDGRHPVTATSTFVRDRIEVYVRQAAVGASD